MIVVDLNLPKKNGYEVIAELRAEAELRHLPVIMLSSSLRPKDREKALSFGANAYIHKPVDLDGSPPLQEKFLKFVGE